MSDGRFDITIRVAEVTRAEPFPEANKPELVKLRLDFGGEIRRSAAQLGYHQTVGHKYVNTLAGNTLSKRPFPVERATDGGLTCVRQY
ncbi:MAG: hypothetical protein V5A44_12100 [Haloarculaceae archaeon]